MMKKFISKRLQNVQPSGIRKINEKTIVMEREGKKIYHFELGRPDFQTPQVIKDATIKSIEDGDVFYTSNFGILELRKAISDKIRKENNQDYLPEEILITAGASESIFDVYQTLLEPGDEILLPNPCWTNYINSVHIMGAESKFYTLSQENDFQIDFEELETLVNENTKAMVIINPSNPIGSVFTRETLEKLADFVEEKDIVAIVDEIYKDIIFDDFKHVSFASLPRMKERTITIDGFSKSYSMTGFRLAYIAAPVDFIKEANKVHQHNTSCATSFVQHAGIAALKEADNDVLKMVSEYEKRRDFIYKRVNEIDGLTLNKPQGAFYAFINMKDIGISCEEFCEYLLDEKGVAIVPGTVFGSAGEGFVRLSYASSLEDIKAGLDIIEEACKHFKNS
ncbi:aspartate/methionine/tyrosine aminotransferase [Peptoniphilus olsenii]|uniref:Aminotransferase n=1 Tax=Peptoniphilus olsenii TaxID=411570 RepID=A0ABV2JBS8_9FIRM